MTPELAIAVATPILGWVIFVERRLARINTIDEKLDLLIDTLVPEASRVRKGGSEANSESK